MEALTRKQKHRARFRKGSGARGRWRAHANLERGGICGWWRKRERDIAGISGGRSSASGRSRFEMSAFEFVHRTTTRSAKRRYNFCCVRGSNRRISVVRVRGVAALLLARRFAERVRRRIRKDRGMATEFRRRGFVGFHLGRREGDETRDGDFAIRDFCGGTLLMASTAIARKLETRGKCVTKFHYQAPPSPESAGAICLSWQPQDSRLNPSDRWLRLLDFTRFPRRHSENREAIALRMRRALEQVGAKAEFPEAPLSRSVERQGRVLIGRHRARPSATTCLRWFAEASSLSLSRRCLSDALAVPRGAARRDRRRLQSSRPQLSQAALSEARTVRGVASSPGYWPSPGGCRCPHEQAMPRGEKARAAVHACDYAPAIATPPVTHHDAALRRLDAIGDHAQARLLLAARGILVETRWQAARIEGEAERFQKRTSASRRPARAAIQESSAQAAHRPPIRSTHREFPETPCANSTQGSNATVQRIQATSANKLPSNRAAAGWRP